MGKKTGKKQVSCPWCKGSGTKYTTLQGKSGPVRVPMTCPACSGSGQMTTAV